MKDIALVEREKPLVVGAIKSLRSAIVCVDEQDLAKAANQAYINLIDLLTAEGSPFQNDPELALKAYQILQKGQIELIESRRRAAETFLKANQVIGFDGAVPTGNNVSTETVEDYDDSDNDSSFRLEV